MSLAELTPGALKRVASAWADPEVTQRDLVGRFGLSAADVELLVAQLGPKAKLGPVSRWSINAARKQQKRRAAAAARAAVAGGLR